MLWTVVAILLILWLLGLVFKIAGFFINILLIVALVVIVYRYIVRR